VQYVFFALAGLLVGGVIATRQQRKPLWVSVVLAVFAAVFLWAGMRESTR
jgi:hypothetical protein